MCVTVNVCRHVFIYRVPGGVSAPPSPRHLIKPSCNEIGLSCCHFFSQVLSSSPSRGVSSLNSQPDAWCPSPLGYSDTAYLSRKGLKPLPDSQGCRMTESVQRARSPDSVLTCPIPPGGQSMSQGSDSSQRLTPPEPYLRIWLV